VTPDLLSEWPREDTIDNINNVLEYVNPIGAVVRTVTINVNERCPLRCRHCSIGFSQAYLGSNRKLRPDEVRRLISAIDTKVYDMLLLAGGEPSLDVPVLRVAIDACKAAGLLSAIVTAPIWAAKESAAEKFLTRIAGVDLLILSYDRYHLEFLDVAHYDVAVRTAVRRGTRVHLHITHSADENPREPSEPVG
jgi:MoaA/NifB/PqqE/SkfB family radical SAM enzyme